MPSSPLSEHTRLLPQRNARKPDDDENITYTAILRYCLPFIAPDSLSSLLIGLLCILSILTAKIFHLVMGLFMKLAVDALSSSDPITRQRGPLRAAILFLLGRVAVAISTQIYETAQEHYAQRVKHRFSLHAFSAVLHHSPSFHATRRTGETTAILRRGVSAVDTLLRQLAFWLLPTLTETVYVTAIFYHLGSSGIAVAVAVTVVVHVVYTAHLTTRRAALARTQRDAENDAWAHANERIAEHLTVAAFGAASHEVAHYNTLRRAVRRTTFDAKRLSSFYDVSADVILQTGTFVGFVLAARDAARGKLSVGEFALAVTYISALFWPLLVLAQSYGKVVTALANAEQLVRLLQVPSVVHDKPDAVDLPAASVRVPAVHFDRVSFAYDGLEGAGGVRDVSFALYAGKVLAIVGPSGAGKSTVVRLLLRLHDAHKGYVRVHGVDVRDVRLASLRRQVALVAQDTVLLSGSVRDNVGYAVDKGDSDVWDALRSAALDAFVSGLADGIDTRVGERGVRLSGGERQRVGIARALVREADVVVLDEATSALSSLDECEVQRRLKGVLEGRAVLVVAHRLASVRHADEILVMDDGYVVERGSHESLVGLGGMYASMWRAQAGTR